MSISSINFKESRNRIFQTIIGGCILTAIVATALGILHATGFNLPNETLPHVVMYSAIVYGSLSIAYILLGLKKKTPLLQL